MGKRRQIGMKRRLSHAQTVVGGLDYIVGKEGIGNEGMRDRGVEICDEESGIR